MAPESHSESSSRYNPQQARYRPFSKHFARHGWLVGRPRKCLTPDIAPPPFLFSNGSSGASAASPSCSILYILSDPIFSLRFLLLDPERRERTRKDSTVWESLGRGLVCGVLMNTTHNERCPLPPSTSQGHAETIGLIGVEDQ